ncbi:hypothetical protein G7077_08460 [Sphingomonas piscis]|uniref:Uncharacterized protein n=1 Tax=Sphingomonas piscis TaxID=2714943 RepID=A0A6G7YQA5_9SPHN|nr:hypothetical protein [Sphingomonas piscis]QIK78925.1 hypothetical protein G7077_08460 [Sphingomonas piscis]
MIEVNLQSNLGASHPQAANIPSAGTQGVRAYSEPDVPHPLQLTFLHEAGEAAWVEELRGLLTAGRTGDADARLCEALDGFQGSLARLCKGISADGVALEGFEDLLPVLEEWEGPAITAITLGLTNPPDLAFEAGRLHDPELLLGLYSDESYPFSSVSNADLLAECAKEMPAWVGAEEDVEFHLSIQGLAELNTALIHCKHRRFLRDGRDGVEARAPGGYVEYVLGCWLLATRLLQAAERAVDAGVLPRGCRLITGTVDVNADVVTVFGAERSNGGRASATGQPAFATLTVKPWVPREDPTAEAVAPPATLRQRLCATSDEPAAPARTGLFARLFGRILGR